MSVEGASTEGMKGGGYYDAHSEFQRRIIEGGDALIRSVAADVKLEEGRAITVADYGAGTGATSVHAVRTAIEAIRGRAPDAAVLAVHNDVLGNDFTQVFENVASDAGYLGLGGGPVYPTAAAGSFFSRVLPDASVDLGMCSNAAHWLREQPRIASPGGMYQSDLEGEAREQLAARAAADWEAFLGARAAELAPGGRFLVQGIGSRRLPDGGEEVSASRLLSAMWGVARELADDGKLDGGALDEYVFPVYCRSAEELAAPVGEGGPLAGALEVASVVAEEVANPYWEAYESGGDARAYADAYVTFVRAFAESTMRSHLFEPAAKGVGADALCDEFFARLRDATAAEPDAGRYEAWVVRGVFARR